MRKKISVIILSIALLVALAAILSIVANVSRKQAMIEIQESSYADLSRYILTLQQKLARYRDIPELLSTHPDLIRALRFETNSNDIARANAHLAKINSILATPDSYLMTKRGMTIASSNWQSDKSFVGRDFSYRPYFTAAMAGNLGQYFALGTTSKKRGFYFSYPVYYKEEIIGVVIVKIDLNEIEQDWNEESTELLVSDEDGVIFISTREDWKFKTLKSLHIDDLNRIEASRRYTGQKLQPLNITQWLPSSQEEISGQIITLKDGDNGNLADQYLVQSELVGTRDLNVSIFAHLGSVERKVLANMIYAGTVYLALVSLAIAIVTRRRISKQRSSFEHRELQALERSEAQVKAIINNTKAGLITLNTRGDIESMNVTAQNLLGYAEQELIGKPFSCLLSSDEGAYFQLEISNRQSPYQEKPIEGLLKCKDGSVLPVEFVVGKMRQQDELHFLITVQDITERKEYEKRLEQSQQLLESRVEKRTLELTTANERLLEEIKQHGQTQNELIQTAKLAVIGQMSAGINHELNQPLMAIRGYADNARKFLTLDKTAVVDKNLNEIALLTERMAKILHPLKEFSRKSTGLQQPVAISKLRLGVLAILYPRLEKSGVCVHWHEPDPNDCVLGELLRLEQVMVNLIGNAMQAAEEAESPCVTVSQKLVEHEMVEISVRDNGVGISDSACEKIFEPFYTTKKEGQGLGLGLSISQRIIEDLGGRISVKSAVTADQCTEQAEGSRERCECESHNCKKCLGAEFVIQLKQGVLKI